MLFAYTYVPHQMERMQEFITFIFLEVWCKAPIGLPFHPDLFDSNPLLKEVVSEFGFSADAPGRGKDFYNDVKAIYELFALLSVPEIEQFRAWYLGNNDIEKVCANDPAAPLARYSDLPSGHKNLCDQLASFFKGLYSPLLGLAALRDKIGDINDHYDRFAEVNDEGKCPFCGISDMHGQYNSKREAYDHYLPKALYPFNSINFKNLVPACHHCNSSYKTSKDPAHQFKDPARGANRRKVFYPYRANTQKVEVSVTLAHADFKKLAPADITFTFGPVAIVEELATWCDVYGIEERYRAKILGKNEGKYWITQAFDEWTAKGRPAAEYLADLEYQAEVNPFADCNFLKRALLKGCNRAGLGSTPPAPT